MKFSFKKIAPICAGAILLGSTIGFAGAMAQSVSYPNDFADAVVVIGSAGVADMAAANNIAADLGKLTTGVETSVSQGWLVKKAGEKLNYGEDIFDIDSSIGSDELPDLLADGVYKETKGNTDNDVNYEQYIDFTNNGNLLDFTVDDTVDNEPAGSYLKLTKGTNAFTYRLKFTDKVKFDNSSSTTTKEDFELSKLKMLGTEWTIIDATSSGGAINKLVLMGGAATATLKSGAKTDLIVGGKSYSVEATVYSGKDLGKASFVINGEELTIDEGSTDELSDGTVVGVTEISTSQKEATPDIVTFYLGARKLVLENGEPVELNGEEIDGSTVAITSSNKELSQISISYAPDEDDVFIGVGKSWTDPVFGAIKFVFAGLEKNTEKIEVSTSADKGKLKVKDTAGNTIEIPFIDNDTNVFLGDKLVPTNTATISTGLGNLITQDGGYCTGKSSLEDCEKIKFLAVDSSGEARIIEIKNIDLSKSEIDFYDVTKGLTIDNVAFVNGTNDALDVGFMEININISIEDRSIVLNDINKYNVSGAFQTSLEGSLNLSQSGKVVRIQLYQEDNSQIAEFNITVESDGDMIVDNIDATLYDIEEDSDTQVGIDKTKWGALFTWDSEDKNSLTIEYPEEKVVANVYVAPISAIVSGGGIVPVVKDTELGDLKATKNLVVVGGSAINRIAAELLKVSFPTYGTDAAWQSATGVGPDMAIIKLFSGADKTFGAGNVALLVAGYEAADTQAAAKYLITNPGAVTTKVIKKTTAGTYA
ncbi:MAG: hypothetical protein QW041_00480 [Candidatus Pacearchaeota archaeon]